MKLKLEGEGCAKISEMDDGDIAVVLDGSENWKGEMVLRYYNNLVRLGQSGKKGCANFFARGGSSSCADNSIMLVRILKKGDRIVIE